VLAAGLLAGACAGTGEEGSGVEASEARSVDPFSSVLMSAGADVVVSVGGAQAVTVRGDDNLLALLRTDVDDGRLTISQETDLDPKVGLRVEITVPALEELAVAGAGDATAEGVSGGTFRIEVSGAGDVEASGDVDRVEVVVSGAGNVRIDELVAREAQVEVSGVGDVDVHATELLEASVSGAGQIVYSGNPARVDSDVSGAGEIRPA
jgi:hypothetical protein